MRVRMKSLPDEDVGLVMNMRLDFSPKIIINFGGLRVSI